jgi:hypothetical protein
VILDLHEGIATIAGRYDLEFAGTLADVAKTFPHQRGIIDDQDLGHRRPSAKPYAPGTSDAAL